MAAVADVPALAALRRAWTAENGDDVADDGFETRFANWYERESARRISWLAEVCGDPVGMMNLAVFERMPAPGRDAGTWGYLANAFVLRPYRSQGIGGMLLTALLAYADDRGYIRVVLRPSDHSIPFYNRAGFTTSDGFLVRRARLAPRTGHSPGLSCSPATRERVGIGS
jgi:GNAT superfamily N-acetyltransferase